MTYIVKAKNWVANDPKLVDQFHYRTADLQADENQQNNCSESVAAMMLSIYGIVGTDGNPLPPDQLKDWRFNQGSTGVIGYDTDIRAMLSHFGGISATTQVVNGMQNGTDGLLDREWQALKAGKPLAWSGWYQDQDGFIYDGLHCVDPSGVQRSYTPGAILPAGWRYLPEIGHWRMVWRQTESQVTCADSAFGADRAWPYLQHYALSRQVLVVPSVSP